MTTLSLAFSPCPNDTFMFDAMVHGKIDTEGFRFDYHIADVEELNKQAFNERFDISKLSFHAYLYLVQKYALLNSGSALGNNVGPLLISKTPYTLEDLPQLRVAIPGQYTTAALLLKLLAPKPKRVTEYLFSDIESAVLEDKEDAGVIIHENRFTYSQRGLFKIADMGEVWMQAVNCPIPLGGIVVKKSLPIDVQKAVERILHRSIEYAFANNSSSAAFVREHAQAMDERVMQEHIKLYVNEFSKNLSTQGVEAVKTLFRLAMEKEIIPAVDIEKIILK